MQPCVFLLFQIKPNLKLQLSCSHWLDLEKREMELMEFQ